MLPIALQLYSIRETLAQDFEAGIRKVAAMGYAGVETAGFAGTTAAAASQLFAELGLRVCSAHAPLPVGDDKNKVLDDLAALGCHRLISAYLPPEQYQTLDGVKQACDRFNEANAVAVENGLSFGVHNHWWEFQPVAGHYPYHLWLERLDPAIFFEIDTYWVKTAGLDPLAVVGEFGERAPLLHIKDGPATTDEPMLAVGSGVMDIPGVVRAGSGHTEWLIVELDRCATDMLAAVEQSYHYLVQEGLGHGQNG
ncbi:MAG: sugar phosphate isomerase/epimerase [Anaerolineae bacterium]|nr:sugar phosphate isomerase/epimerase [Anaerolineae bacterium]